MLPSAIAVTSDEARALGYPRRPMLRVHLHLIPVLTLVALACADDGSQRPDTGGDEAMDASSEGEGEGQEASDQDGTEQVGDGDGDTGDGDGDTGDGDSGDGDGDSGDGDGDTGEAFPVCTTACTSAADCAQPLPAYDEDNWQCHEGGCFWLGCKGDDECQAGQKCRPTSGVNGCLPGCVTPADCDMGIGPYIASNYECDAGACVFTGCSSDAECQQLGAQYTCSDSFDIPLCTTACQSPQDCATAQPAFDADNYACEAGLCMYQGCKAGECSMGQTCTAAPLE